MQDFNNTFVGFSLLISEVWVMVELSYAQRDNRSVDHMYGTTECAHPRHYMYALLKNTTLAGGGEVHSACSR